MKQNLHLDNRIKYFRKLLGITQKELSRGTISIQQIKYLETNKRSLTINTAEILSTNLKYIAKEKNIDLEVTVEELMKSSKELAKDLCERNLKNFSEINEKEYISLCEEYEIYDMLQIYFKTKAETYENQLKYEEAITYYLKADEIKCYKENIILRIYIKNKLGRCNYLLGNLTQAMKEYVYCEYMIKETNEEKSLELDDLTSRVYYGIAAIYYRSSEYVKSQNYIERILELDNPNIVVLTSSKMLLGNLFYKNNQFNKSERIFRELEKENPNNFNIKVSLSVLYRLLDNKSLHLAYLKKLKNYANSDSNNSNFLIEYLMQLKNFYMKNDKNKAIKYYNQALKYAFNYKNLMFIVRIYKDIISDFNKNLIDMTELEKYLLFLFKHKEIIFGNSYLKNELNNIFLELVLKSFLNNSCINIIKRLKEHSCNEVK